MKLRTAFRIVSKTLSYYDNQCCCRKYLNVKKLTTPDMVKAVDILCEFYSKEDLKFAERYNCEPCTVNIYPDELGSKDDILEQLWYLSDRWSNIGRLLYIKEAVQKLKSGEVK